MSWHWYCDSTTSAYSNWPPSVRWYLLCPTCTSSCGILNICKYELLIDIWVRFSLFLDHMNYIYDASFSCYAAGHCHCMLKKLLQHSVKPPEKIRQVCSDMRASKWWKKCHCLCELLLEGVASAAFSAVEAPEATRFYVSESVWPSRLMKMAFNLLRSSPRTFIGNGNCIYKLKTCGSGFQRVCFLHHQMLWIIKPNTAMK